MTLVSIIVTAAAIFGSGVVIFFGIGYIAYKSNKNKNY